MLELQRILTLGGLAALFACGASVARADNIHLCDINATTTCNAGSVIKTTSTTAYVFGSSYTGDTLNVAILTPQSGSSGNFKPGTNLWTVLGEAPAQVFPNFASTLSQETGATGMVPGSFQASDISLGAWTGSVNLGQTITLPNEPAGTIFIAFLENSSGQLVAVSPWSSSLINAVATPEPSSLVLLGSGLIALLFLAWRRH